MYLDKNLWQILEIPKEEIARIKTAIMLTGYNKEKLIDELFGPSWLDAYKAINRKQKQNIKLIISYLRLK